jgi:hypothetical protein
MDQRNCALTHEQGRSLIALDAEASAAMAMHTQVAMPILDAPSTIRSDSPFGVHLAGSQMQRPSQTPR